ncbi:CYGB2 protein, partial [Atractosteus spatula]|nr:CYGB2 protein [Atractosteus spatula]
MVTLTAEDKSNIRHVWGMVYKDPEGNGAVVVIRLFTDHPETKKYFKRFKNLDTPEQMQTNPSIKLHGKRVMNTLNQVIDNLDDWAAVKEILTALAERHRDVHKIHIQNFKGERKSSRPVRLFTDHPETKKYFKRFKNLDTPEQMQTNPSIKLHGKRVMNTLNQVIDNLDDWAAVKEILTALAERHRDVHKIHIQNFKLLFDVIIKVYGEALGPAFTDAACESWSKVFQLLYSFLQSVYTSRKEP